VVRLGELVMILDLHRQGLSVSAIAQRTGLDRKTVGKYVATGLEPPAYGPRQPRPTKVAPFQTYLRERVAAYPEVTSTRLHREIRDIGYGGGYTAVKEFLREVRPSPSPGFEVRFETSPGRQAQVDFAHFRTEFADEPGVERVVWLFSLVLGHSRMLWGRFVPHQDMQTLLRCHAAAFDALGGAPAEILYDRMRTVFSREELQDGPGPGHIVYNRALEALEGVIQQLERGQVGAIEAIDTLLAEEITVREGRRIKAALQMARLATIKTLTGFDFSFQPSLDRNRIMALASLDFVNKHEVVHFIGQSGTGKSHLAVALGVEAIRAGRSVYFCPLADIIDSLAKADREGRLRERIRFLCRTQLLIIDEIGYVTLGGAAGNLFFQLVNARYERGAMILTSNRGFAEWGQVFGDPVIATALLDRLLHHAVVVHIEGSSYRMRQHADLLPQAQQPSARPDAQPKRWGRPPKAAANAAEAG